MCALRKLSRRRFVQAASLTTAAVASNHLGLSAAFAENEMIHPEPLAEFSYGDVRLANDLHETQLRETHSVLMELDEDSLLKPFRQMAGQPAPGANLGGWYNYVADYDAHPGEDGFAPGGTFGQWVSALARTYAITGSTATRDKVLRLNRLYAKTIAAGFYEKNRFPAYCYDKLVCGLIDSHQYAGDPDALSILNLTTDTALPYLPGHAVERGVSWRPGTGIQYRWDESYTMPENLFLAYTRGAGARYRALAIQYLDDAAYFDPLAEGHNVLAGRHAYSYVNALSSAMQAYLVLGSRKHFLAAKNAFAMLREQSFATGGWGPDEMLRAPGSGEVGASLTKSHNSFETPCGSYAHFKLGRYLLRVTRDTQYGDSMERVMYNTVLGAKPLQTNGNAFYYSDYNFIGHKVFSNHIWPCCAGTLPQVAADYRINTYFRDPRGVYVNLYIPSTVRWVQQGAQLSLTQKSDYPFDGQVQFDLTASQSRELTVNLRIPKWAAAASIAVNGKRVQARIMSGSFVALHREWKTGDRIEVDLPMSLRLEAVDGQHPDTLVLLRGPLVLFPIAIAQPGITRSQLLAAKRTGQQQWQVETANGPIKLLPFTALDGERYSTYMNVT